MASPHNDPEEPNCLMGYHVYNRHKNCPYSLICAVCDIDHEQQVAEGLIDG